MSMNRGIFSLNQQVTRKTSNKANTNKSVPSDEERQAVRELQNILSSKNRKPCDCEAQVHELLENCLNCGRITCTAEGPGKCMHCENLILNERQRERLQKYIEIQQFTNSNLSRLSQQRHQAATGSKTLIIDRQFDQFSIDNTKHLKAEDRRRLRENLDELQGQKRQTKLLLHVDIDNLEAGSRSVPQIDDFEGEMRRLQLNYQLPNDNENSNLTLAELIAKESKIKYALDYVESVELPRGKQSGSSNLSGGVAIKVNNAENQSKQRRCKQQPKQLKHQEKAQTNLPTNSNTPKAKGPNNLSPTKTQLYNSVAKSNKNDDKS